MLSFFFIYLFEKLRVFYLFKADRSRSPKVLSFQRFLAMKYYNLACSQDGCKRVFSAVYLFIYLLQKVNYDNKLKGVFIDFNNITLVYGYAQVA